MIWPPALPRIAYTKLVTPFTVGGYGSGRVTLCGEANVSITVNQVTADVQVNVVPSGAQSIPHLVDQPSPEPSPVTILKRRNGVRIFEERENVHKNDDTLRSIESPDLSQTSVFLSQVVPPKYAGFVKLHITGRAPRTNM